jgi:hypothetical protein
MLKRLISLILFASPLFAAQDTINSTVCFQDAQGNCLANGQLTLDLSQPAKVTSGGGQVAPLRVSVTLDANGKIPAGTLIWGNDQLTPSGTTYLIRVYNSNGLLASSIGTVIIQGASPVDLSQLTPVSVNPTIVTNAAVLGSNNAFTGNNTHSGTETFTNAGVFTNTQENATLTSSINGLNFGTEYQAAQGNNFTTEGFSGGVVIPSNSTVHQADGISGFVTNSSTSTNAVGAYSQTRCLANNTTCWGANFVSRDVAGLTTGVTLYGNEIDVNPLSPTTAYNGITGFLMNLNTTQTGTFLGNGAFYVTSANNTAKWFVGFQTNDAVTPTAALFGALCTSGSCASQPINMRSFSSGTAFTDSISGSFTANRTQTLPDASGTFALVIPATSAAFAPGLIAAGACSTQAATTVTGATTSMTASVSPVSDPGVGLNWLGILGSGTVAIRVCNTSTAGITPTSTAYNIRVTP